MVKARLVKGVDDPSSPPPRLLLGPQYFNVAFELEIKKKNSNDFFFVVQNIFTVLKKHKNCQISKKKKMFFLK